MSNSAALSVTVYGRGFEFDLVDIGIIAGGLAVADGVLRSQRGKGIRAGEGIVGVLSFLALTVVYANCRQLLR